MTREVPTRRNAWPLPDSHGTQDDDESGAGNRHSDGNAIYDRGGECADEVFLQEKFMWAFGAPLVNDEGDADSEVRSQWWETVVLRGKQYILPEGCVL